MTQNKIIVTIGRQFGSGGHEVGRRLASELGISFYDHEFVDMAVKKTGFLFAPMEDRVKRKMALLKPEDAAKMTPAAMEKIVKQMDKQRKRYYEYYTDMKWGARDSYDLLINTSRSGIDGAVKIIRTYIDECRGESIMPD